MDEPYSFDELTEPVCKAIRALYRLTPWNNGDSIKWTGPELGKRMKAHSLEFDELLTRESLEWNDEDQGRDPLMVVVGIAIQLGIEQGRRLYRKDQEVSMTLLELAVKVLKNEE